MKYRKKPVEVEAQKLTVENIEILTRWCKGNIVTPENLSDVGIEIYTLEGTVKASLGDYIIKGVKGEFYPCKPDIFAMTYEEVTL